MVEPSRLTSVKQAVAAISAQLPEATGLGSSAQSVTTMDRLIDRLGRADLVGRSALLTPLLLIVVLGGYALVLVAALLNEDGGRRPRCCAPGEPPAASSPASPYGRRRWWWRRPCCSHRRWPARRCAGSGPAPRISG
ncbi:hypothetical protein [Micromonospora sp. ATA51]|uniref:hypothetical protein n=1 Tax=Micromonospora sp. ATA51 TaxID=2806098 RepID=UPI001EE3AB92|nr:hypothetical protein [Micromonospora sp. ATA51]